ncbi:unnamed protein product [Calypogeia fissa]
MNLEESDGEESGESQLPTQSNATEDVTNARVVAHNVPVPPPPPSLPQTIVAPTMSVTEDTTTVHPVVEGPAPQVPTIDGPVAQGSVVLAHGPNRAQAQTAAQKAVVAVVLATQNRTPQTNRPFAPIPDASATSRNSLAAMYAKKCKDKTKLRSAMVGSKEKWKQT